MIDLSRSPVGKIFRLEVILFAFVLNPLMKLSSALSAGDMEMARTQGLALAVYLILAWFTWRRQVVATWGASILMVVNGGLTVLNFGAAVILGKAFETPVSAPLYLLDLVIGLYFLYAGTVVFRQRPSWKRR
ncbi:hypothetical protein [Desulfovibrio oxyclinae]|uniref:hypothetical protein n=1 Tax=Desulfovibrio oxyclinae TaxID=63560 RepID=UPI00036774E8|nr:hypothetical protein [Desulfovibrio oxyclinae]